MAEQRELQEKILTYRILQSRLDGLLKDRDLVANKIVELQTTITSIDEAKKSDGETLFPLGPEAYVSGKITNKEKVIVEIGANIALEKSFEEGKETLGKKKAELEKNLEDVQNEISEISSAIQELTPEIQAMIQSQQAG